MRYVIKKIRQITGSATTTTKPTTVDWSTVWVIDYGAPYYPVSQRFSAPVSTISVIPAMFCLCLFIRIEFGKVEGEQKKVHWAKFLDSSKSI